MQTPEKVKEMADKLSKNSPKTMPKVLKSIGKLDSVNDYDDYKTNLKITLVDWFLEYIIIKAFLISICLLAFYRTPPYITIILAEGSSILWFLLVELKRDLWRKE